MNPVLQGVARDVSLRHRQCLGAQVGAVDLRIRPAQGRQHGQAAVAGAQVQHPEWTCPFRGQPGINDTGTQHFGDQRARHDGALVDEEGHALQPGLASEVGGRLARRDALRHQQLHGSTLCDLDFAFGHAVQVIQRQSQTP